MKYLFRILRYDPEKDAHPYFQDFSLETAGEKKSLLEALIDIRNEQDNSLAFRYSCREAICGSCAMVVNGRFDLACRAILTSLDSSLIIVEPLPNLKILKDLIVDMDPFWEALYKIDPYLFSGENPQGTELRVTEKDMEKIDQFTDCIMCGCCYSACPVIARDERYLGPIALAKLNRFVRDPRDGRSFESWLKVNTETGIWGCDMVFKCNEACPKDVRPADGIEALRRKFIVDRVKRIFERHKK